MEKTTVMDAHCMTLRDNTERTKAVEICKNELLVTNHGQIKPALEKLFSGKWKQGKIPIRWLGKTED